MRYKVSITEQVLGPGLVGMGNFAGGTISSPAEVDGAVIFSTVVEHRPDSSKLVEALKAPRIRKSRSKAS